MTSSVIQRLVQGRAQNDEFIAALEQARQQCRRAKNQTTLAMVEVRSASYHEAAHTGSEAALDMVAYIQSNLRNTDQVFPCGNQQVAILLSGTHIRNAVCLAERLRAQLDGFFRAPGEDHETVTSIGLAQGRASESSRDWISRARSMCDHASMMGQSWVSFDPITEGEQPATNLSVPVKPEARSHYHLGAVGA